MSDPTERIANKSRPSSSDSSPAEPASSARVLPDPLTANDVQQLLLENQKIIQAVYQSQNLGKLAECCQYLEILQRNVLALGMLADKPGQVDPNQTEWPPSTANRWALDEVERLRLALSAYGPGNMASIVRFVATKSEEEIMRILPTLGPPAMRHPLQAPQQSHLSMAHSYQPHARPHQPPFNQPAAQHYANPVSHQNAPMAVDPAPSPPPTVATVSMSQLTSMRSAHTAPPMDRTRYAAPQNQTQFQAPPQPSQVPLSFVQPNQAFIAQQTPPLGGTISFSSNPSPPVRHSTPPPGTMSLGGIRAPSSGTMNMSPPSEVQSPLNNAHNNSFSSYQTYFPPSTPPGVSTPVYSMAAPIESNHTPTHALPTVPPAPMMAQPAISISMDYDISFAAGSPPQHSSNPSPPTARRVGVYTPAPGQVMVNMDKTTLFTPSNPPRPGSPRSPRSPKTPKSPKTPLSPALPLSPKSPGANPVSPKSPKDSGH